MNGVETKHLPELPTYECLVKVADHKMDRKALADFLRKHMGD